MKQGSGEALPAVETKLKPRSEETANISLRIALAAYGPRTLQPVACSCVELPFHR
jgi:hypothetical protein